MEEFYKFLRPKCWNSFYFFGYFYPGLPVLSSAKEFLNWENNIWAPSNKSIP